MKWLTNFYDKLVSLSAFPQATSIEYELKKVAILRIILGIVVFVRFAQIANSFIILDDPNHTTHIFLSCIILVFILIQIGNENWE